MSCPNTIPITARSIYQQTQLDYAFSRLDALPIELVIPFPSEWAEENRYLTEGESPDNYGQFDWDLVPHRKQILDDLHPDSPYNNITDMKSVQSAGTVSVAENLIGFVIRYKLGSLLFLTSTKGIGQIRGSANIDIMIDNSGLSDYIKPASNRSGRKISDNAMYKEFSGGLKMLVTSYNSIADLKSNTFHYIIKDELDEAGAELKDQGDIEGIIEGRTRGVRNFKIYNVSTPSRAENSRIYKNYLLGDQNRRFCPCPHCGEKQELVLMKRNEGHGLTFTAETDKKTGEKSLVEGTVRYVCKFCGKDISPGKKMWMLQNGVWIPQSKPANPKRRSYYSSGLISPFMSWDRVCLDFIETKFGDDLLKFKDFTINVLGLPWMNVKKSESWETMRDNADDYSRGEVPGGNKSIVSGLECYDGPLILFAGADVQGDRLELLVTGFGMNGNKWAVDHRVFYGNTSNPGDQCWESLSDFMYNQAYRILDKDIMITCCALDAGWDPKAKEDREKDYAGKTNTVYDFVAARSDKFIAVMGSPNAAAIGGIMKESRITGINTALTKRYMVNTPLLKELIMNVAGKREGFNCIHVPKWDTIEGERVPMSDEFYQQFLSERYQEDPKRPGEYKWMKTRARNEVLDMFIYSIAAAAFYNVNSWTVEAWSSYYLGLVA